MARKKILIVDDEEDLTWSIVRDLSKNKHHLEVFHANSGSQALDLLNTHAIDLLLTDMRMPGINGRELIQQVRSAYPQVKIILMTAFSSPEIKEFVRHFHVNGYMEKPFEINNLRQLIYASLDRNAAP
jgi:DNA-binding NtrC family response regulator